ncbi:kinase-like domain-containing protein, partial [Tribonema minus]
MWSIGVIIYILLGGYPPFHENRQTLLFRKIRAGKFEFHNEYWGSISSDAQDLITRLLTVDISKRLTAAEAIVHPWLLSKDSDLAARSLEKNFEQLKLFNARRKLCAAIHSIITTFRYA